jgi:hypothetical protein
VGVVVALEELLLALVVAVVVAVRAVFAQVLDLALPQAQITP